MGETPSTAFPTRLYMFLAMTSSEISIFIEEPKGYRGPITISAVGFFQVLPSLAYVANHYQHCLGHPGSTCAVLSKYANHGLVHDDPYIM